MHPLQESATKRKCHSLIFQSIPYLKANIVKILIIFRFNIAHVNISIRVVLYFTKKYGRDHQMLLGFVWEKMKYGQF